MQKNTATFSPATTMMIRSAASRQHLSHEEELELFYRWKKTGDKKAAEKLVISHIMLMVSMVRKLSGYGMSLDDLLGQATIGIMKALERFEPERGFRLNTFARNWIFESMMTWVMGNRSILRGPSTAASRTLFYNLGRAKKKLHLTGTLTLDEAQRVRDLLAEEMPSASKMTAEAVMESERFLNMSVLSADARRTGDEDSPGLLESLHDDTDLQDTVHAKKEKSAIGHTLLEQAIESALTARQQHIFRSRRLLEPPLTLEELGNEYGVSRERIRQIEASSFIKVQAEIQSLMRDRQNAARERQEHYHMTLLENTAASCSVRTPARPLQGISNPIVSLVSGDAHKRSEATKRGNITRGAERRSEITQKANETRGAERRREISIKAAATVRAKKAARLVRLQQLSQGYINDNNFRTVGKYA